MHKLALTNQHQIKTLQSLNTHHLGGWGGEGGGLDSN